MGEKSCKQSVSFGFIVIKEPSECVSIGIGTIGSGQVIEAFPLSFEHIDKIGHWFGGIESSRESVELVHLMNEAECVVLVVVLPQIRPDRMWVGEFGNFLQN